MFVTRSGLEDSRSGMLLARSGQVQTRSGNFATRLGTLQIRPECSRPGQGTEISDRKSSCTDRENCAWIRAKRAEDHDSPCQEDIIAGAGCHRNAGNQARKRIALAAGGLLRVPCWHCVPDGLPTSDFRAGPLPMRVYTTRNVMDPLIHQELSCVHLTMRAPSIVFPPLHAEAARFHHSVNLSNAASQRFA